MQPNPKTFTVLFDLCTSNPILFMENGENLTLNFRKGLLSIECGNKKWNHYLLFRFMEGRKSSAEGRHVEVTGIKTHVTSGQSHQQLNRNY